MNLKVRFERAMSNSILRVVERKIIDMYKTLKLYKYYGLHKGEKKPEKRKIIAMIDGKIGHGGLSDRFWGILSIYKYCKENNEDFKLYFRSPYDLSHFLVSNEYKWNIEDEELSYDIRYAKPLYISLLCFDYLKTYSFVKSSLKSKMLQLHIYSNTRTFPKRDFNKLFFELFKLTPELEREIERHKKSISGKYVSITFRFQQLLGDFHEGNFPILRTNEEKNGLINKCIDIVKSISKVHNCRILVTSDSSNFLNSVQNIDKVYVIPGKVVHVDFCDQNETHNVHLKSFVDLFMLANADKLYLGNFTPLYHSGFPMTASCIGGKPYEEISEPLTINDDIR